MCTKMREFSEVSRCFFDDEGHKISKRNSFRQNRWSEKISRYSRFLRSTASCRILCTLGVNAAAGVSSLGGARKLVTSAKIQKWGLCRVLQSPNCRPDLFSNLALNLCAPTFTSQIAPRKITTFSGSFLLVWPWWTIVRMVIDVENVCMRGVLKKLSSF